MKEEEIDIPLSGLYDYLVETFGNKNFKGIADKFMGIINELELSIIPPPKGITMPMRNLKFKYTEPINANSLFDLMLKIGHTNKDNKDQVNAVIIFTLQIIDALNLMPSLHIDDETESSTGVDIESFLLITEMIILKQVIGIIYLNPIENEEEEDCESN